MIIQLFFHLLSSYCLISQALFKGFLIFKDTLIVLWSYLVGHIPKSDFLADVISFEAVAVGIAIPISFEIISRISERYNSDVVVRLFQKRITPKLLPLVLVSSIICAIILKYFESSSREWIAIARLVFIGIFVVGFLLLDFFALLFKYAGSNDEDILNDLFREIEKYVRK